VKTRSTNSSTASPAMGNHYRMTNCAPLDDPKGSPDALVTTDRQPLLLASPAEGYCMVHRGNIWQRIVIQNSLKGPGTSG
jgi:hypothetical protein